MILWLTIGEHQFPHCSYSRLPIFLLSSLCLATGLKYVHKCPILLVSLVVPYSIESDHCVECEMRVKDRPTLKISFPSLSVFSISLDNIFFAENHLNLWQFPQHSFLFQDTD